MTHPPGLIALFGSGETSASGRKVYDWVFSRLAQPVEMALLETPAGFQPNSAIVAGKVATFIQEHLQNYQPRVSVVPARRRGGPFSTDDPSLLAPMLAAHAIFLGPGSPTYAVRQLEGSAAWEILRAAHRQGAALLLASAATIAGGAFCLPVYEIYKSGDDLHWRRGLDLLGAYGLHPVFVPHWDNSEGGAELDTSRCFMGMERFARLLRMLPEGSVVTGIDEHTALVLDLEAGQFRVLGRGGVTVLRAGSEEQYRSGRGPFPMELLGGFRLPAAAEFSADAWAALRAARWTPPVDAGPPAEVTALLTAREEARTRRDWPQADSLRDRLTGLGWRVMDTPSGPVPEPLPNEGRD